MTPPRCAWCGGKLEQAFQRTSFCGKACQRAHEDWCAVRAAARTQAVSRWRDMQQVAKNGDMLNELLSIGSQSSAQTYFSAVGRAGTRSER
jgi:hypothetical protein